MLVYWFTAYAAGLACVLFAGPDIVQVVPEPMPDMKTTIEGVLDSCGMSAKRANKLTQDDLLTYEVGAGVPCSSGSLCSQSWY